MRFPSFSFTPTPIRHTIAAMILVTGATGFIGRSLMACLAREDREAKAYNGRINAPLTLRQELEGVDTVIHLAGSEARGRDRMLNHVDVDGTERLLEECRRANVQHLIFASRIGADALAIHPLLKAKGECERLIQRSSTPHTTLHTATLFGHGDRSFEIIVGLAMWSWPFVWLPGGGQVVVQPLWVEDFVRCIVQVLDDPDMKNKTITVAGEERIKYRDLVQQLLRLTGIRRIPLPIPMVLLRPFSRTLFSWWYWPAVSTYFVDRFFVPDLAPSDSVLRHFGFRPTRFLQTATYLNRSGLRWRLFRR